MAVPNISEIVTTTINSRSRKLADNMSDNNAILHRLRERGRIKTVSGGESIYQEISFTDNSTVKNYSGYESLDVSPSEVFSAAEFDWKQKAVAVTISGLEELKNSGKERMIDLLESRIENAEMSMENSVASDMYSDGTGDGGKQIGGLQHLVADSPSTGTVGGIDRSATIGTFWRNIAFDATTDGGAAASSSNIQGYMNKVYLQLVRGTEAPDLILADNNYYGFYLASLQTIQRVTSDKMAQAGFTSLKYMGADVVLDGGVGGACPTNHMYFLNTKYIHFRPHAQRNFVPLGGERFAVNQDAIVKLIVWAGNMTLSAGKMQGVLKD